MRRSVPVVMGVCGLLLTLGCNLTLPGASEKARVVVHLGDMQLAANADLAIVLDVRGLQAAGYNVQQVASTSAVQRVSAKVSGVNLAEPLEASVNVIDCAKGLATLNFSKLPPGPVDVVVNALDFEGKVVSWQSAKATIEPLKTIELTLHCTNIGGGLAIKFDCPELCAPPSPSPTPVPICSRVTAGSNTFGSLYDEKTGRFYWTPTTNGPDIFADPTVRWVAPFRGQAHDSTQSTFVQKDFGSTYAIQAIGIRDANGGHNGDTCDSINIMLRRPDGTWWTDTIRGQNIGTTQDGVSGSFPYGPYQKTFTTPIDATAFRLELVGSNGWYFAKDINLCGWSK